jgi:beta-mannosidase
MQVQPLTGAWAFRQAGTGEWMPATVPGGVHTDLLDLGRIPDPFVSDNETAVLWVAELDWEYRRTFVPSIEILDEERIFLVADGLDAIAEVRLNGELLGRANNQFRRWRWEIADLLGEGENELTILFSGPTIHAATEQRRRGMNGVRQGLGGAPHVRKAPCQFGWDWGPKLPSIGIWKDVRLEGRSVARLEDVHLRQVHGDGALTVRADVRVEAWGDEELRVALTVRAPDKAVTYEAESKILDGRATLDVRLDNPLLWWPNGYGEQPLYHVCAKLTCEGRPVDEREYKIGLRTLELQQQEDAWGRSFRFVVNGVPIFAKGSNWIPADAFVTRVSNERLDYLIRSVAATHQNMLRVWGGGFYEDDRFYDLCDRYGILVWQDFVFSCSTYPLDEPGFHENVRIEVDENVRRLRHRTSLALWCGNNEIEWFWESRGWAVHDRENELKELIQEIPALRVLEESSVERDLLPDWRALRDAYDRFFHETLPDWVAELDPDTPYWSSSPSSSTPFRDVNSEHRGDAHYWDVWHGRKPFTAYRAVFPRFMSEFGFQSFPTMETVEFYTGAADRNPSSRIMEHHQRGRHGNGLIVSQMTDHFRVPRRFADWIYLSLVLQAEGIRYGVEHWRRHMERVGGTLYWQLDDCWPVASWSSIDFFGRWKALHYAARRFYAPVLLSVEDKPPVMDLHVSNDLPDPWAGSVRWSLETLGGEVVESAELTATAAPLSDVLVASLDFGDRVDKRTKLALVLVAELRHGEDQIALSVHPFVPSKHLELEDPRITVQVEARGEELVVRLTAQSLARFVELKFADAPDVVFSDNYFDLPADRTAVVTCSLPEGWLESTVKEALRVRSLFDSYSAW